MKKVEFNMKTRMKLVSKNENEGMCKLIKGYLKTIKNNKAINNSNITSKIDGKRDSFQNDSQLSSP